MVDEAFLRLSAQDRRNALGVAADRSGRPAHLLEKDVWVVWALGVRHNFNVFVRWLSQMLPITSAIPAI